MGAILDIFKSLGVDSSITYQFIIFTVMFILLKFLVFNKLQAILELRESKTTRLEERAEEKLGTAQKNTDEYRVHMQEFLNVVDQKTEINIQVLRDSGKLKIQEAEEVIIENIDIERKERVSEVTKMRSEVQGSSKTLADDLANKLLQ